MATEVHRSDGYGRKVEMSVGDTVEEGSIMILESMKMEIPIEAPETAP